jgi:hypothetical protein
MTTCEPFLLPGRFTIRVLLRKPEVARDSDANLVILSDSIKIVFVKLDVSLSITSFVACSIKFKHFIVLAKLVIFIRKNVNSQTSGVTSLGENPLPPVVNTRFSFKLSDQLINFSLQFIIFTRVIVGSMRKCFFYKYFDGFDSVWNNCIMVGFIDS